MKKKTNLSALMILFVAFSFQAKAQEVSAKLNQIFNHNYKGIIVASHRGDWRNAPENSIQALQNCIAKGFDLMELDVKMTKDSQLVVMHDNTIDRTTNGKGKVIDFTLAELKMLRLKNGLGRVTPHQIPTLIEMMQVAKNKILINVDKGNDHLDLVFAVLKQTGTTEQTIVNIGDNVPATELVGLPARASIMVVVNMKNANALDLIKGYENIRRSVIQPIFDLDTLENLNSLSTISTQQVIWLNSLWPSLNGGHDDDTAVELGKKDETWGWLLNKKPVFLQTDRPVQLIEYLKSKSLHK
ncbi:glycerophosphodiester phosphodiesterase family protein [Pedobacter sp. AW1-32]|uniref:glycerophosphodiester phosphodiesterase family protein n=1 Tax=Pedobacter sp. AW1-32 TaxID=3383026 RepID=UPI003FEE9D48